MYEFSPQIATIIAFFFPFFLCHFCHFVSRILSQIRHAFVSAYEWAHNNQQSNKWKMSARKQMKLKYMRERAKVKKSRENIFAMRFEAIFFYFVFCLCSLHFQQFIIPVFCKFFFFVLLVVLSVVIWHARTVGILDGCLFVWCIPTE